MTERTRTSSALVVEGGAMRGVFAAGVLDYFLERDYCPFDFCLGVSAGATNLASWLAGQHQRGYRVITDHSRRPQFIRFGRFLRGGHVLDLDWIFETCAREIPLNHQKLAAHSVPLLVVTTRVDTGEAVYTRATEANVEQLLKASCSVPVAYRHYPELDGVAMTDGGVADSIPVLEAYRRGACDITVLLSQPSGYRKLPPRSAWLVRKLLPEAPQLAEAILHRHHHYNRAIDFILNPPTDCRIRVLAPAAGFAVKRFTKDLNKLNAGYEMGRQAASQILLDEVWPLPAQLQRVSMSETT